MLLYLDLWTSCTAFPSPIGVAIWPPDCGNTKRTKHVGDPPDQIDFPQSIQELINLNSPLPWKFLQERETVEHSGTEADRYLVQNVAREDRLKLHVHWAGV